MDNDNRPERIRFNFPSAPIDDLSGFPISQVVEIDRRLGSGWSEGCAAPEANVALIPLQP